MRGPVRIEADGTRVYEKGTRYRPVVDRKYAVRKPDDPRAVRFRGEWLLPLELAPDEARVMPETRPDSQTLEHRAVCTCEVCKRPEARILWARQRRNARLPT